jgi:MFS transporter, DHA2 family, methylenomycin A resistance protein
MRRHLPLLAICVGYFMVILDATIVNVALAAIGRDLGGGVGALQWVIDAYTVVFAGLLLSAGSLGDRVGARRVLDAGLGVFTAASLACALAPSVRVLVGARAVQGLGAALLVPSSLALLRGAYRDPAERARAVGAWGAVAGIGAASGPVLGGLLVALASWRAVFIVNVPVGLLAMRLSRRHLPPAGERSYAGFDPPGQVLGVLTLTLLTLGLIEGGSAGWGSPLSLVGLIGFGLALVAFVAVERRSREPMLPLSLFGNRTFSGASFVGLAINLGFYGQLFAMSLYFQRVRGFSALQTGLALLPEGVFVARWSQRASGWRSRCRRRRRRRSSRRPPSASESPRAFSTPPARPAARSALPCSARCWQAPRSCPVCTPRCRCRPVRSWPARRLPRPRSIVTADARDRADARHRCRALRAMSHHGCR